MRKYVIALYIRLSVEDIKTESLSIPNQRLILREKAMSLPEWDNGEVLEFDGGSGGRACRGNRHQGLLCDNRTKSERP